MKPRKYKSIQIGNLLSQITPLQMDKTKNKMELSARIEGLMISKGWTKSQFAEKVDKKPSEITKWLSGTQNLTIDTLTEIAQSFGIPLSALFGSREIQVVYKTPEIIVHAPSRKMEIPATALVTNQYYNYKPREYAPINLVPVNYNFSKQKSRIHNG
jgi:transcriptional regulator with XRE-family HTH domain